MVLVHPSRFLKLGESLLNSSPYHTSITRGRRFWATFGTNPYVCSEIWRLLYKAGPKNKPSTTQRRKRAALGSSFGGGLQELLNSRPISYSSSSSSMMLTRAFDKFKIFAKGFEFELPPAEALSWLLERLSEDTPFLHSAGLCRVQATCLGHQW